jgi:hypothetical protein
MLTWINQERLIAGYTWIIRQTQHSSYFEAMKDD